MSNRCIHNHADHVHGIIALIGAGTCADIQSGGNTGLPQQMTRAETDAVHVLHWSDTVHRYKTAYDEALYRRCQTIRWSRLKVGFGQRILRHVYVTKNRFIDSRYILDNPTRWEFVGKSRGDAT